VSLEKLPSRLWIKLVTITRFLEPGVMATVLRGENPRTYVGLTRPWLREIGIRTVIDIGANTGQFAVSAKRAYPRAQLHCFEPLPACFEMLRRRVGTMPNVSLYHVALAEGSGHTTMFRNVFSASSSLLEMNAAHVRAFPFTEAAERINVVMSTLDHELSKVALEEPMLVKIDVQGAEDRVIAGGKATLARTAVAIVETSYEMLYEGQPLFDEINGLMRDLGFCYHGNLAELRSPIDGRVLQSDSVFVRDAEGAGNAHRA
jgi:FkbM family methyltransferase